MDLIASFSISFNTIVKMVADNHRHFEISHKPIPVPIMMRPKDPDAAEKEARLQQAITTVLNNECTCRSVPSMFPVEL